MSTDLWRHPFQVLRLTPHGREVVSSHRFEATARLWAHLRHLWCEDADTVFDVRPTPDREDVR